LRVSQRVARLRSAFADGFEFTLILRRTAVIGQGHSIRTGSFFVDLVE